MAWPGPFSLDQRLEGVRSLQRFMPLFTRLRKEGCERDRAGNRDLYFDHVCGLILLTFFNPSLESLRDLSKASRLKQIKKKLGCSEASLGSLSESLRVFDPERLVEIVQELLGKLPDSPAADERLKSLGRIPTAVDGTLLRQLPQITQACFAARKDRGWKLHTHFEVLRGAATFAKVTDASGKGEASEKTVLRESLQADRCYITDRGYEQFSLFNAIVRTGSSYVCRVRQDHHFTVESSLERSKEAIVAGVQEDAIGKMGSEKSQRIEHPDHLQRRLIVKLPPHPKRTGRRRNDDLELVIVTDLMDVPAEVIVLLYRFRWMIELFFRWLKCVLSCRHLVSQNERGIQIQMYCALIACLMIQLATGSDLKPNQWTYKLICLYLQGLAEEGELIQHLEERIAITKQPA
jgi:hypothetical protein